MGIETLVGQLVIGLALAALSYVLTPRPQQEKPPAAMDLEAPTAEAGRTVPVVFGTIRVKGLNVLWYGDIQTYEYDTSA